MATVKINSGLPYDITTEQNRIARRRKIIEAMEAASFAPSSAVIDAGAYKVANWGDPISKIANAWSANKAGKALDEEDRTVAADANQRLSTGVQDYIKTKLGGPQEAAGPPSPDGQMPSIMSPGNPTKAIADAMGSGLGPLQAMAMKDMENMGKGALQPKDILSHLKGQATPQSVIEYIKRSGDPQALEFLRTIEKGEGGVFADTTDAAAGQGPVKPVGYAGPTYAPPQPAAGGMPPLQQNLQSGKVAGVTGGNVTPPDARGEGAFEKGLAEDQIKNLSSTKESLNRAFLDLPSTIAIGPLADKAYQGAPWSELQIIAAKAGAASGFVPDTNSRIPASEQLASFLGKKLLANTRPLGSGNGFSNKDLEFLQQVEGTGPVRDPRTVKALAALNIAGTMNVVEQQDRNIQKAGDTRQPETARKLEFYRAALPPLSQGVIDLYKLRRDPSTGMWTSGLVDEAAAAPAGGSSIPGIEDIVKKYGG